MHSSKNIGYTAIYIVLNKGKRKDENLNFRQYLLFDDIRTCITLTYKCISLPFAISLALIKFNTCYIHLVVPKSYH